MNDVIQQAKQVFDDLCAAIEARDWKYTKEEDKLMVHFGVRGEDIPMHFLIIVDAPRQYIRLLSPMGTDFPKDRRIEGAVASCAMNRPLIEGSFDYDCRTGKTWFRQSVSFRDSKIGDALFQHMISYACAAVDIFNDRLDLLAKGEMTLTEFLESVDRR